MSVKINNETYDWGSIKIYVSGVPVAGATEINFKDSKKKEHVYGGGSNPRGSGHGNYEASGDFTMAQKTFDRFELPAVAVGKTALDYAPFTIVVAYGEKVEGSGSTIDVQYSPTRVRTIENVEILDREFGHKQGDTDSYVKCPFIASRIR